MKRILILFSLLAIIACGCNATSAEAQTNNPSECQDVYKLYPTDNMWTFIKLNTADGRLWIVQYDIKDSNQIEVILNVNKRAEGADAKPGRFELYKTQNMYNFILLDQIDGRVWQAQWSHDIENRFVIPIN